MIILEEGSDTKIQGPRHMSEQNVGFRIMSQDKMWASYTHYSNGTTGQNVGLIAKQLVIEHFSDLYVPHCPQELKEQLQMASLIQGATEQEPILTRDQHTIL